MKHGIVGRQTSGYFRYQGWPTVARAEDGTIYAASSGALILSCGKRTAPYGQYARISWDKGHTWEEDILISEEAAGSPVDEGYPSSIELPGGDILTVYYQPVPGDDYPSILYTRWKLPKAHCRT